MTIDFTIHKNILFQILKDIYTQTAIAPLLGFKGGTAAFMFHGLDRFSVDLDFDLLDEAESERVFEFIEKTARQHGAIKESRRKRFSLLVLLSYDDKSANIKIEVNRRAFGSRYELKTYLGVAMQVMIREDMFAHKLMAMHERIGKTSRDIYDVWFFLKNQWPINKDILEKRAGISYPEVLKKCITQIEKIPERNLLRGLGELLTDRQKDWARTMLKEDVVFLLKLALENEKHGSKVRHD
ncbi:MAG TPA: nucleotidyl transferase AbiEii/AbiGii toxin family protein [Deltaproteobacteria bacterium]|nr:nucleotidyl transferase AbiEii/AbiGii toxin family protein [Deltaproteobacteria bacterium]